MKWNCIILLVLGFVVSLEAQYENRGWELGGRAGVSYYFGDHNTDFDLTKPGAILGVGARYNINNRLALSFMFNGSRIYYRDEFSDNLFQQARNLSFRTDMLEWAARFEFNFLEYIHGDLDYGVTPYLHGGLGVFYYRPTAEYEGERYNLRSLGTEGQVPGEEYFFLATSFIYGAGLKIDFNYRWSMQIDLSARLLGTDFLDDVSGTFPGEREIRDLRTVDVDVAVALSDRSIPSDQFPQIGEPGRQRGNGRNNDSFAHLTVGMYYYFGHVTCPRISPLY